MKLTEQTTQIGALAMTVIAMGVLSYLAVLGNEACQGALIAVVSAGTSYFLRGKVQV